MAQDDPLLPGPSERRLYMIHGQGIRVYNSILRNEGSVDVDKLWTDRLPQRIRGNDPYKFTGVEIHAHGLAANIYLDPVVNMQNVEQFGALISNLVNPGSLIEVMSCLVASCDFAFLDPVGRISSNRMPANADANIALAAANPGSAPLGSPPLPPGKEAVGATIQAPGAGAVAKDTFPNTFDPSTLQRIASLKAQIGVAKKTLNRDEAFQDRMSAQYRRKHYPPPKFAWRDLFSIVDEACTRGLSNPNLNGPQFCTKLAKASGCIVRAAWIEQETERHLGGLNASLIGDWEGWVFDFDGNGLKEVYFYLERPIGKSPTWVASAIRPATSSVWVA